MIALTFSQSTDFRTSILTDEWRERITVKQNGSLYTVTINVDVDDSSYRYRQLMGKTQLLLKFSLPYFVEFPVGTTCVFQNQTFTLNDPENIKKQGTRNIEYTLTMGTAQDHLSLYKLRNSIDGRLKWSMYAKPHEFIEEIVKTLNARDGNVWFCDRANIIEATEKTIEFNHIYCDSALAAVAVTFETEYEIIDHYNGQFEIALHKVEYFKDIPLPLSYGKGNGFVPGLGRSTETDGSPIKRLYVQGGEKNIDRSKYAEWFGYSNNPGDLRLPKGQILEYEGRQYKTDENGYYIERYDKISTAIKEDSLDCSEIYPSFIGHVTKVEEIDKTKNFYDIIDSNIPAKLNFNDYLIEGENMTLIFQTGMLAGREFDVKYKHEERRWELVPIEQDGITMPNEIFIPSTVNGGDEYAIFGIMLPKEYICDDETKTGAAWDMFKEAVRYLYDNEDQKFTFTGELQGLYAKNNWLKIGGYIKVGSYIHFTDNQFATEGVDIRIIGIKDYVNSPYSPTLTISNSIQSATSVSSELKKIENTEILVDNAKKEAIQFTKRRFRDAKETISLLEEAMLDNFTESISPIAVQTMSALVGDESLQFEFGLYNGSNWEVVSNIFSYDNVSKTLRCNMTQSGSQIFLRHLTIGINSITSEDGRKNSDVQTYLTWPMISNNLLPIDTTKGYYLYARVNSSNTNEAGTFLLSEKGISLNEENGYYHLLCGILNSEYNEERSFVTLYGFTEILPGRITTGRIVSADGKSFLDLENNAFKLGDRLLFNTNKDGQLILRGTLVQSSSGATEYIGCYRGVYNPSSTYFQGDEVVYTYNKITSFYRYINSNSSSNIPPTNTLYWQIIAEGSKGEDGKNGENGKDGENGNYTELRFAKNGSISKAPDLNKSITEPSGWSLTVPSIGEQEYLWMTKAVKSGVDNSLIGTWSDPVRMTGEQGKDGKQGESPALVFRGVYNNNETYYGNKFRLDCVKFTYNKLDVTTGRNESITEYFVARIDSGEFRGNVPTNTDYWNPFGASFDSIATGLLLAENANIANLLFRNQRLESVASTNGIPNFFIDGLKNEASFAAGNVLFRYDTAKIGWLNVIEQDLIGYDKEGVERIRLTASELPELSSNHYNQVMEVVSTDKGSCSSVSNQGNAVSFYGSGFYYDSRDDDRDVTSSLSMSGSFTINVPSDSTSIQFQVRGGAYSESVNSNLNIHVYYQVIHETLGRITDGSFDDQDTATCEITIPKKGKVTISVNASCSYQRDFFNGNMSVDFSQVRGTSNASGVIIAKDGFAAIYNGNYLKMTPSAFDVRFGNYRLQIDAAGMRKSLNNGENWNSL